MKHDNTMHMSCWMPALLVALVAGYATFLMADIFELSKWWAAVAGLITFAALGYRGYCRMHAKPKNLRSS